MKITRSQLRQIINEAILKESQSLMNSYLFESAPSEEALRYMDAIDNLEYLALPRDEEEFNSIELFPNKEMSFQEFKQQFEDRGLDYNKLYSIYSTYQGRNDQGEFNFEEDYRNYRDRDTGYRGTAINPDGTAHGLQAIINRSNARRTDRGLDPRNRIPAGTQMSDFKGGFKR